MKKRVSIKSFNNKIKSKIRNTELNRLELDVKNSRNHEDDLFFNLNVRLFKHQLYFLNTEHCLEFISGNKTLIINEIMIL